MEIILGRHGPIVHQIEDGHKEATAKYGTDPREYQLMTTKFVGDENGEVKELHTIAVEKRLKKMVKRFEHRFQEQKKYGQHT